MLAELVEVVIGVDTHKDMHTAAVVDTGTGGVLARATVPADPNGYTALVRLVEQHSGLRAWTMEGTGGYGAGLARHLAQRGELAIELDGPLPDGDEPAVGRGLRADRGLRPDHTAGNDGRRGAAHRRDFPERHGHLGHAAPARVPPALLGRVSSLDFLVSGAFMPLAGPVSGWIGLTAIFLVVGLVPLVLAGVVVLAARMPVDDIAHPLDRRPVAEPMSAPV